MAIIEMISKNIMQLAAEMVRPVGEFVNGLLFRVTLL